MPEAAVAPAPTPASPAPSETHIDLDALRAARAKPADEKPAVAAKPADDDEPVDDDTAAEIDKLETPAENESPQSRSARRRKHRAAAQKALVTKANNALKAANDELSEWREGKRAHQPPPAPTGASPAKVDAPTSESTRPKPTVKDFPLEKFKDEDDPYTAQGAALAEALTDWKIEQRDHAASAARQRTEAETETKATLEAHGTREADAKTRYPDYDAVLEAASFPRTPHTADLLHLTFKSEVSADMAYFLAKNPCETLRLLAAPNQAWLRSAFQALETTVTASLAPKKPAVPKVNATEEPTQPVAASAAQSGLLRNPMQDEGTAIDLDAVRAHRRANGR